MKRLVLWLALAGCGHANERALSELSGERLARAGQLQVAARAQLPHQEFVRAREAAQAAPPDSELRHAHASEARLWLEMAISQAELLELSQARLQVEEESARVDELLLSAEAERMTLERQVDQRAAAGIAREEATRALERAALAPRLRTKLAVEEVRRAAASLLARAELIELALPSHLEGEPRSALSRLRESAQRELAQSTERAADRALELADQALFQALAALGKLRAKEGSASPEQKASLQETLGLAGLSVTRDERGLSASLPASQAKLAARTTQRVCDLARAYPLGPVQITRARSLALSKSALSKLLSDQQCSGERFSVVDGSDGAALAFTFLGY